MTIFIEAKNIGKALRRARSGLLWPEEDVAKLFGVSTHVFQQYERGAAVMPFSHMQQIFAMGLMMMRARQLQSDFCNLHARYRKAKNE